MKKILLSLLVIVVFARTGLSQAYFPFPQEDASWKVIRCFYFYQPGWYDLFTYTQSGDTIISNVNYNKLYLTTHHLPGTIYDTTYTQFYGAMREDQKKIYVISNYTTGDDQERIIYDFNVQQVGDTLTTNLLGYGDPLIEKNIVWKIDSILVSGIYHRSYQLKNIDGVPTGERWTEGIGSNFGLAYSSFHVVTDNSYDLRCFTTEGIAYQNDQLLLGYCQNIPEIPCDFPTSVEGLISPLHISVFPNPAEDEVKIHFAFPVVGNSHLRLYNSLGEKLTDQMIPQTTDWNFNLSTVPPGIYWLQLVLPGGARESVSLVVQ